MTVMLHHGNYSLSVKKVLETMKVCIHSIITTSSLLTGLFNTMQAY